MRWQVPVLNQSNPLTCWEACGHMMWLFRYTNDEAGYKKRAGKYFAIKNGLDINNTDTFYRSLGMLCSHDANERFIRHLIYLGPLIVMIGLGEATAHAEVLIGFENSEYIFNNPQSIEVINFDGDDGAQVGGEVTSSASEFRSQWVWWWPHKNKNHSKMLK